MTTSVKIGNRRLLVLAAILDTADAEHRRKGEPTYNQTYWYHYNESSEPVGPACAGAHWEVSPQGRRVAREGVVTDPFAVNNEEWNELFSGTGCNNASTAKQAAKYIRGFVRRREKALAK